MTGSNLLRDGLDNEMKDKAILNICPEEEFFGREREIDGICSRAFSEGPVTSGYLWGRRKSGKTEILKRVYNRLFWGQDKVVPFYYSVKASYRDSSGFAEDYLSSLVRQYLAFLKKDPLLVTEGLPLSRLERMAAEEDVIGLTRLLTFHREGVSDKNHHVVLKNAISAPHLVSLYYQPYYQTRVFVILDDFHLLGRNLFPEAATGLLNEYPELLRSHLAPHIITGNSPVILNSLFRGGDLLDTLDVLEINGLDKEKSIQMLEGLCRIYGVRYDKDVLSFAARQLGGNPFYLRNIARGCQKAGTGLSSLKEFMNVYVYEVMKGGISCYLSSLLSSLSDGSNRMAIIRFLRVCMAAEKGISLEVASERSGVRMDDMQSLLKGMQYLGIMDTESGVLRWDGDAVLADFIDVLYGVEIKGFSPSQLRTETIRERLKEGYRFRCPKPADDIKEELGGLLEMFNGQKLPMEIFQNSDFLTRYCNLDVGTEVPWKETIILPQIVGCFESQAGKGSPLYLLEGQGFYDGRYDDGCESFWIVGVKDSSEAVSTADVNEFLKRSNSIREKTGVAGIVRWLVGRGGFSADSLKVMAEEEIFSSDYKQFQLLKRFMEDNDKCKTIVGLMPLKEFNLVIPMSEDAELVAARALEEVARKVGFDDDTVSQVKMAIIEACINAFEHSRVRDGKVSIKIFVERDRLVVHVLNEGKVFDISDVPRPDIDAKINSSHKRGWGIELMKGLMDEVAFEDVEGGTKLVMAKHVKDVNGNPVSVRGLRVV